MLGSTARRAAGGIAILAWTAVVMQLIINFGNAPGEGKPLWSVPLALYGYFTVWSNTLVALVATHAARGGDSDALLARSGTLAATTVYIIVVGVIYNLLLAATHHPVGDARIANALLHIVVPLAYPLWWLTQMPRGRLGWNALAPALVFPVAYSFVAMGKGAITGKYAYFFIDVGKYGVPQVLLNIGGLALLYSALMAVVIAFDRRARGGAAMDAAA